MMSRISLGTRSSQLALIQTEMVRKELERIGVESSLSKHVSQGDKNLKKALYEMKGVGVFVRELNDEILRGNVQAAVHSAKDVPSKISDSLEISAVLKRGPYNDVLVSEESLGSIKTGSVIGTSSIRRLKELATVRPDLKTGNVRGNIQTRLSKLSNGEFDGIIIAQAAIERLSIPTKSYALNERIFVPAPNQGIIAVISKKDSEASDILREIDDADTRTNMEIERRIIEELNLGCSTPVGILSKTEGSKNRVFSRFFSLISGSYIDFEGIISSDEELAEYIEGIRMEMPQEYGYGLK